VPLASTFWRSSWSLVRRPSDVDCVIILGSHSGCCLNSYLMRRCCSTGLVCRVGRYHISLKPRQGLRAYPSSCVALAYLWCGCPLLPDWRCHILTAIWLVRDLPYVCQQPVSVATLHHHVWLLVDWSLISLPSSCNQTTSQVATLAIYINGEERVRANATSLSGLFSRASGLKLYSVVGANSSFTVFGNPSFQAWLDDVVFFKAAYSNGTVQSLYQGYSSIVGTVCILRKATQLPLMFNVYRQRHARMSARCSGPTVCTSV
jgi:hypothetical protein